VESVTSEADVVFSTVSVTIFFSRAVIVVLNGILSIQANADDFDAMKAILSGLKKRYEATGQTPLLIHTVRLSPPYPVHDGNGFLARS
jgi:hypothetical protein